MDDFPLHTFRDFVSICEEINLLHDSTCHSYLVKFESRNKLFKHLTTYIEHECIRKDCLKCTKRCMIFKRKY